MRKSRGITTYSGAHANVVMFRGKAQNYLCKCGEPARDWAYGHDEPCPNELINQLGQQFSLDPKRYRPMCRRCHRLFDGAYKTHCPRNHPYSGDNLIIDGGKRKCRTCVYERNAERRRRFPLTPAQRRRKNELQNRRRAIARGEPAA